MKIKQEYYKNYTMTSVEIEQLNEQIQNAQAKIIVLQQKEADEKAELETKQTTIEPNMKVFSEWLESMELKKKEYEISMQSKFLDVGCELGKLQNDNEWGFIQTRSNNPIYQQEHKQRRGKYSSKKVDLFQTKNHKASDMPSEFMIHFIEATHNLFQIQQKRIEELEKKVYDK